VSISPNILGETVQNPESIALFGALIYLFGRLLNLLDEMIDQKIKEIKEMSQNS